MLASGYPQKWGMAFRGIPAGSFANEFAPTEKRDFGPHKQPPLPLGEGAGEGGSSVRHIIGEPCGFRRE